MVDIITAEMVRDQIKKIFLSFKQGEKSELKKYLTIAMLVIVTIIAIILVSLITDSFNSSDNYLNANYDNTNNYEVTECNDPNLYKFITDYFNSRTNLNFSQIFSAFGRDYYKEEREDKNGSFKKIIDSIRYERIFVKGYDNIKVYTTKGYYDNETVCIVTYDLSLGFTNDMAPMMIVFYVKSVDNSFVIKDNLDVGTSKYILKVTESESVKRLYNDIYAQLNRLLLSNESLKLSYNSLRQFEMNMNADLGPINKVEIINEIGPKELDPIKDAEFIYNDIYNINESKRKQNEIDEYIERVIASLSDVSK